MDLSEHGNWKDIEGYPDYAVSDKGFVLSKRTMKMLKGCIDSVGYRVLNLYENKVRGHYRIHVLVASAHLDKPDGHTCVDHIDRNKLNNDVSNLRWCSYSQNGINKSKLLSVKTSFCKGVFKQAQKWIAQISLDGKRKHIGSFESEVQAANAYNNAAIIHFKEFACLNKIPPVNVIDI